MHCHVSEGMKEREWLRRKIGKERSRERLWVRERGVSVTFCLPKSHLTKEWGGMEWWGGGERRLLMREERYEGGREPGRGQDGISPQVLSWHLFKQWLPAFLRKEDGKTHRRIKDAHTRYSVDDQTGRIKLGPPTPTGVVDHFHVGTCLRPPD